MAKISICVTYYNQEQFVKDSLESVLAIDFPCDYEILIGDDGSTDNTVNVIKEYQQKYPDKIKLFVNERNENQKSINRASKNRLNLAENATGDYLLFLDGDDFYCDKNFVKEAITILENNKELAACAFYFKLLCEDKSERFFKQNIKEGIIKSGEYISKVIYIHSGAIVFKNVLNSERLELLKQVNGFDDNGITIFFLQFGDLYYFNRFVYVYRQSHDSLWNSMDDFEQNFANAMEYKTLCDVVPKFKKEIAKREYKPMKYVYERKDKIRELLGEKYERYLNMLKTNNDTFLLNLVRWEELSVREKINMIRLWFNFWFKHELE